MHELIGINLYKIKYLYYVLIEFQTPRDNKIQSKQSSMKYINIHQKNQVLLLQFLQMNYLKSALKQDQQLNETLKSLKDNNFSHSKSNSHFYLDLEAFQSDDSRDDSKRITQTILEIYERDKLLTQDSFNYIKNIVNRVLKNQSNHHALQTLHKKVQKMKDTQGKDFRNYLIALSSKIQKEVKRIKRTEDFEVNKANTKQYVNSLQQFIKNNTKFKVSQSGKVFINVMGHTKKIRNSEAKNLARKLSFDQRKLNLSQNQTPEQYSDCNQKILSASKAVSNEKSHSFSGSSSKQNNRFSSSDYSFDSLMLKKHPYKTKRRQVLQYFTIFQHSHIKLIKRRDIINKGQRIHILQAEGKKEKMQKNEQTVTQSLIHLFLFNFLLVYIKFLNFQFVNYFRVSIRQNMDEQKKQIKVTLHYFNIRGVAQPIRNLLYYLEIPFNEKIYDSKKMNQAINDQFFNSGLPKLQIKEACFSDVYTIMRYLANRANRNDLLGHTPQIQARINEVLSKYFVEKNKLLPFLINGLIECSKQKQTHRKAYGEKILKKFIQLSKLVQACLIYSRGQTFVMGNLTILDFFFYEICFYVCNMFSEMLQDEPNLKSFKTYKNMFQKSQQMEKYVGEIQNRQVFIPFGQKQVEQLVQKSWSGSKQHLFH